MTCYQNDIQFTAIIIKSKAGHVCAYMSLKLWNHEIFKQINQLFKLPIAYCLLPITYYLLSIAYYLLPIASLKNAST